MKRSFLLFAILCFLWPALVLTAQDAPWEIRLTGVRTDVLRSDRLEDAKEHRSHYVTMEIEVKGEVRKYSGIPLDMVIAMVDGTDSEHPYTFNADLWMRGYDVTVTAGDGYAVTFNTSEVPVEGVMISDSVNGKPTSPTIVGDLERSFWVKDVAEIELDLSDRVGQAGPDPDFRLVVEAAGEKHSFSLAELESSPFYVEENGWCTNSAGTVISGLYGGVNFPDLLRQYVSLKKEDTITVVAYDGYEMSYQAEEIMDDSDGEWILSFKENGEYMPFDPGYVRNVKVSSEAPSIPCHSSVKMIAAIVVSGQPFRDFSLEMTGKKSVVIDRQTLQAGISCHKRTVNFERKNTSGVYTGIPLWRLLAYSDDPRFAPHEQDKEIISYREELAREGYQVEIVAADGFTISLDSKELDGNDDVILAMYKAGEELTGDEWPLVLVWDKDAELVPDGIKPVRQVTEIHLLIP